jgi:hypothetical protein
MNKIRFYLSIGNFTILFFFNARVHQISSFSLGSKSQILEMDVKDKGLSTLGGLNLKNFKWISKGSLVGVFKKNLISFDNQNR